MSESTVQNKYERETFSPVSLYEMSAEGTTYYFTDCESDISFSGITYSAIPIKRDVITSDTSPEVAALRITASNITGEFTSLAADSNGFVGETVIIKLTAKDLLDDSSNYVESLWFVDTVSIGAQEAEFTLVSRLYPIDVKVPKRKFSRYICQWVFKDPNSCQYSGDAAACTKTFYACEEKGNLARFGGFPDSPSDEKIYRS